MGEEKESIVDAEYTELKDESKSEFVGMGEKEAKALQPVVQRFMESYAKKEATLSDEQWLNEQMAKELPEKTTTEIQTMSRDILTEVATFDRNMASINAACDAGQSREDWFQEQVQAASVGVGVNDYGNYLANIDRTLYQANTQMMRAVTTNAGEVSQCFNLDGFIAEQQHVNSFNAQAALERQSYRAEVLAPEPGETYGLNSFDVAIKDVKSGKILHQYQFKFGQDAQATIRLLKDGGYNNQRFIVPTEQLDEIRKAFPGKSVSDVLGGTEKVPTRSEGMTKAQAKQYQHDIQDKNQIKAMDWNSYSTKELAFHLGKNAAMAGLGGAALATGIHLAAKVVKGEKIRGEEVVEVALTTGADAGVKAAAVGALKVGVEKGMVPMLVKGTPVGVLSNIVCLGIENAKIMAKFAKGEISGIKAMDCMARTSVATVYGLGWCTEGAAIGAAACSFIPVVGTVVGGVVGGMVGYAAGSKFGSAVYSGAKKIASVAKSAVKSAYHAVKSIGRTICSGVKSVGNAVASLFGF